MTSKDNHMDWDLLTEPGVEETLQRAAARVTSKFDGVVEYADLLQEAYLTVAGHPRQFRPYLEQNEMGLFFHAVWCDLMNVAQREARFRNPLIPLVTE